jgi:hypothetical protein
MPHPDSAAVADLNGDGHVDVVTASSVSDEVSVAPGTGGDGELRFQSRRLLQSRLRKSFTHVARRGLNVRKTKRGYCGRLGIGVS